MKIVWIAACMDGVDNCSYVHEDTVDNCMYVYEDSAWLWLHVSVGAYSVCEA